MLLIVDVDNLSVAPSNKVPKQFACIASHMQSTQPANFTHVQKNQGCMVLISCCAMVAKNACAWFHGAQVCLCLPMQRLAVCFVCLQKHLTTFISQADLLRWCVCRAQ